MARTIYVIQKHLLFLVGILLIVQSNAFAQDDTLAPKPLSSIPRDERTLSTVPDKAYFKSWLTDSKDIIFFPVRWNKYQWIAFSGIVAVTAVLLTQDANIQRIVQKNQNATMNYASKYGLERLGSGEYTLPALGLLYGVGAIIKNDNPEISLILFWFTSSNICERIPYEYRSNPELATSRAIYEFKSTDLMVATFYKNNKLDRIFTWYKIRN